MLQDRPYPFEHLAFHVVKLSRFGSSEADPRYPSGGQADTGGRAGGWTVFYLLFNIPLPKHRLWDFLA